MRRCRFMRQLRPDLAVACLGLNDAVGENGLSAYTDGLRQMGALCAAVQKDGKMDEYMENVRRICREEKVTLGDCYAD